MNQWLSNLLNKLNSSGWWVSFNVHSWLACTIVYHVGKALPIYAVALVFAALTAFKEYYWDAHFETPPQQLLGSSIDWGSYMFGAVLALVLMHFGV